MKILFADFSYFCYFNSMPSYRTHVSVNLFVGLPLSLAALKYLALSPPQQIAAFSAGFVYGTFFLHPDLDLARNIRLFSLKGLLTLPFRPYSYLFKHRGISHMPIIGTFTRIAWLTAFFYLACYLLGKPFPKIQEEPYFLFPLIGLTVADLIHLTLDGTKILS